MMVVARVALTVWALAMLALFWLMVTGMNIVTAVWDSCDLALDVARRVLANVWAKGEART